MTLIHITQKIIINIEEINIIENIVKVEVNIIKEKEVEKKKKNKKKKKRKI